MIVIYLRKEGENERERLKLRGKLSQSVEFEMRKSTKIVKYENIMNAQLFVRITNGGLFDSQPQWITKEDSSRGGWKKNRKLGSNMMKNGLKNID